MPLIENGRIISPYTDKKTAHKFNLPLTGSASGEYDKVPPLSPRNFKVEASDKTLKELLKGQLAVASCYSIWWRFYCRRSIWHPCTIGLLN